MDTSNYVFGREMSFEKAYPDLEDIVVEFKQYKLLSPGASGDDVPVRHSIRMEGGRIPCDNPACINGGYRIDSLKPDSDAGNKTGTISCGGHENMGLQKRSCFWQMRYRVQLIRKAVN